MAMLIMQKHINASPETVFRVATDLANWSDLIRGIERIEPLTEGPMRVGTRYRETRKMFGKESTEEFEVTALDAPHGFDVQAHTCGMLFTSRHRFVPDISGTLVELTLESKPQSIFARLMAPLGKVMMGSMKKLIDADLEDLKAIAEQRAAADWVINPDAAMKGYTMGRA